MTRLNRSYWFFILLAVLGLAAVVIPWFYNAGLRLTPEGVKQARNNWLQKKIPNYDLDYLEIKDPGDPRIEVLVKVRNGNVETAVANGQFIEPANAQPFTVEGVFDRMEKELPNSEGAFITGTFSLDDGHPTRFVKRKGKERFEILLRIRPVIAP